MFQGCFEEVLRVLQGQLIEGDSRELKGYLKEVQRDQLSIPLPYPFQRFKEVWRVFQENFNQNFKVVSRQFQRCFKEVSRVFKESVKCASRKFHKKVSRVFQVSFYEVLFCNFVVARIS